MGGGRGGGGGDKRHFVKVMCVGEDTVTSLTAAHLSPAEQLVLALGIWGWAQGLGARLPFQSD